MLYVILSLLLIPVYTVPPQIVSSLLDVEVELGHSVSLTCAAEGTEISDVTWGRGDIVLVSSERLMITTTILNSLSVESVLLVSTAELEDTGDYSCTASSAVGNDTRTFHLFVTGKMEVARTCYNDSAQRRLYCLYVIAILSDNYI